MTNYIRAERIILKNHLEYIEKWVQNIIADDPSILGLGNITLKDKERIQPNSGRLDLLFQDSENDQRYEVEIQLGKTDETHIIRTLEYWDIEKKRYPQYEHCAVLIAEDITSRFFNVINLFNGFIPIVAIQLNAIKIEGKVYLVFTKVLKQITMGLDDDDESDMETTDRAYWENKANPKTVKMADDFLTLVHEFDNKYELKYNKHYIGLSKDGIVRNFILIKPWKKYIVIHFRMSRDESLEKRIEDKELDLIDFSSTKNRLRLRINPDEFKHNIELMKDLVKISYKQNG
jgi:hypothetical protein